MIRLRPPSRAAVGRGLALWPWTFPLVILIAATAALAVALTIVDRIGERIIAEETQAAASAERDYLAAVAREEGLAALIETLERQQRLHGSGFHYSLTDAGGRPLAGAALPRPRPGKAEWRVEEVREHGKLVRWQVVARALPNGEQLAVAQRLDRLRAFRTAVFRASAWSIVLAVSVCIAAGAAMNALLLARAGAIAQTAARIASGDLSARVDARERGDVFDRLGLSINQMLARMDDLMTGLRTVTDSLAHDLRTPLMRLKGALARAAAADLPEADRQAALEQAHAEAEHTLATFTALLDIAQAETGLSEGLMAPVDVSALAIDLAELFEPVFEDAGQALTVDAPAPAMVQGHELLLRQAVGNLLHNASLYAGREAAILLRVENRGATVRLVVADDGPGVPEPDRGRVQERFVRLDSARSTHGTGLGLAIAAACAKLHHGTLVLEDNEPGLRVVLTLARGAAI